MPNYRPKPIELAEFGDLPKMQLPVPVSQKIYNHSEETKRKIGESVSRRAARKRELVRLSQETLQSADKKSKKKSMPEEQRAKISAAMKGRAKSESHREKLRKRFVGDQNPMYGRKMSEESRQKISKALAGKKRSGQKVEEETIQRGGMIDLDEEMLEKLRAKARDSNLLSKSKKKRAEKDVQDSLEAEQLDELLERVARLDEPPESVVKTRETTIKGGGAIRNSRRKRGRRMEEVKDVEQGAEARETLKKAVDKACVVCSGTGFTACAECVGSFGVATTKCPTCFGAGHVFCEKCQGAGVVV